MSLLKIKNSLFLLFFILTYITPAFSCVCADWDFSPDLEKKHLKYLEFATGKVLSIKKKLRKGRSPYMITKVKIKIHKNFYNKKSILIIWTGANHLDCGFHFKKGASYFIAFSRKEKKYKTNSCLPTKNLKDASKDLFFLEKNRLVKKEKE